MRSQVFQRGPVAPQMNITPLIDVVFLLIVFFMLVTNLVSQESVKMIVPRPVNPATHRPSESNRIVVNVTASQGNEPGRAKHPLAIDGRPGRIKVGIQWFEAYDLAGVTRALERARRRNAKLRVLLRADAAVYYRAVAPVLQAIANAGVKRVDLAAYEKKGRGRGGSG